MLPLDGEGRRMVPENPQVKEFLTAERGRTYSRRTMDLSASPVVRTVSGRRPSMAPMAMRTRRGPLSP